MGRHFSEVDFFCDIFDGFLKICRYFEAWGVLTMLIVKLRNAVKICDKITFCAARFSWIKVRYLTDSRFKRVGVFRRMTFLAKSRRNSGGQSSDITVCIKSSQKSHLKKSHFFFSSHSIIKICKIACLIL